MLAFYRQIRMRYPSQARIYLIADNLDAHKTPEIRGWAAENTELVFTPTYASFLNRIECHFWGINEFVINNADYPDWDTLRRQWPTTSAIATGSPRRTPDQGRTQAPDRRLTHDVSGQTLLADPLAS